MELLELTIDAHNMAGRPPDAQGCAHQARLANLALMIQAGAPIGASGDLPRDMLRLAQQTGAVADTAPSANLDDELFLHYGVTADTLQSIAARTPTTPAPRAAARLAARIEALPGVLSRTTAWRRQHRPQSARPIHPLINDNKECL